MSGGRVVETFAVARHDFARASPLAQFRLGGDGGLYQLVSFPDGVRVLRYEMGGMR